MAKISIIIPTYNRAHVLSRAIDSVLSQSFEDYELIIVDDGSDDETKDLVIQYGDKIKYFFTKQKGVSAARNLGIKESSGEWIALLDSDDEWLSNKLEKQVQFIESNPEVPLVHGEEIWIRNGKRVNPRNKHKKFGGWIFEKCIPLCVISPSASLIKKDILLQLGGFDERFPVCEDYDLWLKLTAKFPVGFIEDPIIVKYGGHQDQLSRKYFAMDFWRVKSLLNTLECSSLDENQRTLVQQEIVNKAKILKQGYLKHQNLSDLPFIEEVLARFSP